MRKGRIPGWLILTLAAVAMVAVVPVLWVFVSLTATQLHPNPESVPTVSHSAPSPKVAGTVDKARQIVRAHVAGENLPGLSIAVGIDGELVWAEGFGYADLKTGTPVTPGHRFRIGTASAVLTSAAAGLLLENGTLKLDDEIQTQVPAFPRKQWPVTLRALMGHTAGLNAEQEPLFTRHCEQTAEALPYFAQAPLLSQPGTQYRPSNYNWILASASIESAANQPFLTFMHDRIFGPLGMRDTMPDPTVDPKEDFPPANMIRELIYDPEAKRGATPASAKQAVPNRVTPYYTRFASDPNYGMHVMRPLYYSCYAGAGVFISTPSDLVLFGMAMNGGKLLTPETVNLLQTTQRLASGQETGFGLGWYSKTVSLAGKQTNIVGHDGDSLGGMVASLMSFPEQGIVVAATSNISHANTASVALKIAEAFAKQR